MSDRTPTLWRLLDALKKVDNWFMFGAMLGVPFPQLKKIESHHQKDPDRCKLELLQYWLDNTLDSTWNRIVQALEKTDQLTLAAQIKHEHLLPAELEASVPKESSITSPGTPPSSAPSTHSGDSPVSTPPTITDEIKAEIEADATVVRNLKELEFFFGRTLVQVKRHLDKCDLSEALLFLDSVIGSDVFIGCDNFGKLMRQLRRDHIDVFNISVLQQLVTCFDDDDELNDIIKRYNEEKESFLQHTTVLEFQRAVVSRVEPILTIGMASVTITISRDMASHQTLKDVEKLAMEGFEECHKKFIHLHAEPGSIIISWLFPKGLRGRLEQLARDNAAVFEDNGVLEVTVGGRRVFPCTQQESEEKKSKLKQLYTEFYQQLVEAVSDPDTCHSLTTQLHSTSLLSEEKKAVLSSSMASGSSYLKVLGLEEEPHLVTVLMEKMLEVKKLQTLSENMSDWLKQDREQVVVGVEKLTSENSDLLARLQHCEVDLNKANELLKMRERTVSGMIAAVNRSDTDLKERDEMISHLKKELEEIRREGAESKERIMKESEIERQQLQAEIESLLTKLKSYEEDLKIANKLLIMREKAISGMMTSAAHRKGSDGERRGDHPKRLEELGSEELKTKPLMPVFGVTEAFRSNSKIILIESTAPMHCPVELRLIPADLKWKFFRTNPDTPRYWVKLIDEESYKPPLGMGIREHSADKHHKNIVELKEQLEPLLRGRLTRQHSFVFSCEARLGRLAWRASEIEGNSLSDVCIYRNKEFYTRTTTKASEMIEKLQSRCFMRIFTSHRDTVTFQVEDMEQNDEYKVVLNESPPGTFTLTEEGYTNAKIFASSKAEIICIGRSHDVRIASDCKSSSLMHKHVPHAAMQAIETIAESVQRTETGQLKMILMSGCVKVEHVRQKKTQNFTTTDRLFGVNLSEIKEINVRSHYPEEDELVTLEYNTNQEIEIKMTEEVRDQDMIPEILDRVEKLVAFALDVVDMAEECRDPDIPY